MVGVRTPGLKGGVLTDRRVRQRTGVAAALSLGLLGAPLLCLRNAPSPERERVVAAAAAPARTFTERASRSARSRPAAGPTGTARAAAPTTTVAPTTVPPATAPRALHTTRDAAPATTTTTTAKPAPPATTAPPPPKPAAPPPTGPPTTAAPAPAAATTAAHTQTGEASWYRGPDGECAHNSAPIGSIIRVTNLDNGRSTTCRVAGRGPYGAGRIVDLTETTFARLAPTSQGVFPARVDW